ncbi:hypothetical protein BJY04DRAFT_95610 [Aspergillus karnatakaensis]|uniref:uncharacterized protein n=1 Tax=Aspergillus karnatakaensis TaxID=1810916 RepID=UPI003CCE1958
MISSQLLFQHYRYPHDTEQGFPFLFFSSSPSLFSLSTIAVSRTHDATSYLLLGWLSCALSLWSFLSLFFPLHIFSCLSVSYLFPFLCLANRISLIYHTYFGALRHELMCVTYIMHLSDRITTSPRFHVAVGCTGMIE